MPGDRDVVPRARSARTTSCRPSRTAGRRWSPRSRRGPARSGFGLVVTPIFEHIEVFQRVGRATDVVRKEMYDFDDKGGRRLALRPEGTASVVRAFVAAPARRRRGRSGTSRRTSATSGRRRAATASTGRSASRCSASTTPTSTSRSSRSRTASTATSGCAASRLLLNSMGDADDRGRVPSRCCARYLARARRRARRRDPRAGRGEPAARPRLEARRLAGR